MLNVRCNAGKKKYYLVLRSDTYRREYKPDDIVEFRRQSYAGRGALLTDQALRDTRHRIAAFDTYRLSTMTV